MTLEGTVFRAAFLLLLLVGSALWPWSQHAQGAAPGALMGYLLVGMIGGLVVAMLCVFRPTTAPVAAPLYAVLEGLALGALSAILESRFPGIAMRAISSPAHPAPRPCLAASN